MCLANAFADRIKKRKDGAQQWYIDDQISIQTKQSNSVSSIGEKREDWKKNNSTHGYPHKQWIHSVSLQLNNNALYWSEPASVSSTKAITPKADWCVFQHTQQKYHIEVQTPRTSKTALINPLTTTEYYIINLQMIFNYISHCCYNQGRLIRT